MSKLQRPKAWYRGTEDQRHHSYMQGCDYPILQEHTACHHRHKGLLPKAVKYHRSNLAFIMTSTFSRRQIGQICLALKAASIKQPGFAPGMAATMSRTIPETANS